MLNSSFSLEDLTLPKNAGFGRLITPSLGFVAALLLSVTCGCFGNRGFGGGYACNAYAPAKVFQEAPTSNRFATPADQPHPRAEQQLSPQATATSPQFRWQSPDPPTQEAQEADAGGTLFDPTQQKLFVDEELSAGMSRQQMVQAVVIKGNHRIPTPEILRQLKTRAGRYFDPDLLQQDIQAIWRMPTIRRVNGPFLNKGQQGITITFFVEEHPFINELKFVGNRQMSDSYLRKETGLEEGKPLNDFEIKMAREKIEELYHSKGHTYTSVELMESDDPGQVVFVIYEDKRRKISSVSFVGNTIATDARLGVIVKSKPQKLWLFGGNLDREQVDRDLDILTAYYFSLGFFNAKIGREIQTRSDSGTIDLKFVINEGPRYRIRDIRFTGNEKYSDEQLRTFLKLQPAGEEMPFFNSDEMNSDVVTLRDTYGSVGHIFADVQAQPHFLSEPGVIDLVYQIDEGKAYRVGRINIHIDGDGVTQRNVVLNHVTQKPGDLIDIRRIRQSERLMRASQLFGDQNNPNQQPRIVIRPPDGDEPIR